MLDWGAGIYFMRVGGFICCLGFEISFGDRLWDFLFFSLVWS